MLISDFFPKYSQVVMQTKLSISIILSNLLPTFMALLMISKGMKVNFRINSLTKYRVLILSCILQVNWKSS